MQKTASDSMPLLAGDPFILFHNGLYYAYGTTHADGILVYVSEDLHAWRLCENGRDGFALRREDTGAEKWFWAPEVYPQGDGFAMYFSRDLHISCARAPHPAGPFVEVGRKPIYDMPNEHWIDDTCFVDDDGQAYIYFSRRPKGAPGSEIWGAELEDDHATLRDGSLFCCFGPTEEWELRSEPIRTVEGPFMLKHEGKYYLTYTANHYESHDYAVGYAVSETPRGPFRKTADNPILRRPGEYVGTGHHAFFHDREGRLRIVFHAHFSATQMQPRRVLIGAASFEGDRLTVSGEIFQPVVVG